MAKLGLFNCGDQQMCACIRGRWGSAEATGEHRATMTVVQAGQNSELFFFYILCQTDLCDHSVQL